jgi:hypothetical protein
MIDGVVTPGHVHGGVLFPNRGSGWIVHVTTTREVALTVGTDYALRVETREGIRLDGKASLRRSDGQAHYFTGDAQPERSSAG